MISNKVLDERYTRMLIAKADLDLRDVIASDKVQKSLPLTQDGFQIRKDEESGRGRASEPIRFG